MRALTLLLLIAFGAPLANAKTVEHLSISTSKGVRAFTVEVVREESERNKGLMYRRKLARSRGMLFDYDPPQRIDFWMKNTYIPLDIIFIGADGRIITIAERTKPLSEDRIPSKGEARGILEINGGLSRKLGIKVGDKVRHKLFEPVK